MKEAVQHGFHEVNKTIFILNEKTWRYHNRPMRQRKKIVIQ